MKRLCLIISALICIHANAQKGVNKLVLGVDIGFPTGDFSDAATVGGGPLLKFILGITPAGDITATTGAAFYSHKDFDDFGMDLKQTWTIVPVLMGYRHNFASGLFLEPQLGMGIYTYRKKYQGGPVTDTETALAWAAGMGYAKKNLELGARYQSLENDGSLSQFLIHIGYVLPLKNRR